MLDCILAVAGGGVGNATLLRLDHGSRPCISMIYVTSSSRGEQDVARLNDHRRAPVGAGCFGTGAGPARARRIRSTGPASPTPLHRPHRWSPPRCSRWAPSSCVSRPARPCARTANAPAGDNAIEYYLALRDKTPDDASVKSALTDLLPYTLIAAEHLGREDYTEAQRLVALIEKVDASAPALPRLKDGLSKGVENAAKRTETEAEKAKKDAGAQQAADRTAAPGRTTRQEADGAIAAQQDAARRDNERQEAERQPARREAEQSEQRARPSRPARAVARLLPRPPCARSVRRRRAIRPRHCVRERRAKCWWRSRSVPTARWSTPRAARNLRPHLRPRSP